MKRSLLILSLCLASALSLAQTLTYRTNVRASVDDSYDEVLVENNGDLQTASVTTPTGHAIAQARIAPGVNSVYSHWESLDANAPASGMMADAWTHWTDTVLISDEALNGTVGTFTASLRVFGNAGFNLTGGYTDPDAFDIGVYGFWDSWIGTSTDGGGSFLVGGWFGDWYSDETGTVWYSGDELNQPMTDVTLEFIYGEPFLLRTNMEAYFDATNLNLLPGTVEGTLDFSHTTYWNGISGFYDTQGNSVTPSYWSQSGMDWRSAVVPEPGTWAVLGLGAVALVRRRRH